MLERGMHQGMGLLHRAPAEALRFAAVGSAPDALGLQVLWLLCEQLQRLGYPTIVLDGCAVESTHAPGLEQLLEQDSWRAPPGPLHGDGACVAVLPAARGLLRLPDTAPLAPLHPLFRAYALVLLHAPVHQLAELLPQHTSVPLILTTPGTTGTQQAYRHIKQLAVQAGLSSQVCALVRGDSPAQQRQARTQIATLQRCAADYLGLVQQGLVVDADNPQDLQRMALQLLENAGTIEEAVAMPPLYASLAPATAPFVRSH